MTAYGLRTEARTAPREIDAERPMLSWKFGPVGGAVELGESIVEVFRIHAGAEEEDLLWTSHVAPGEVSVRLPADLLAPCSSYRWTLVLTYAGGSLDHAVEAHFETGLRGATSWRADWIARDDARPTNGEGEPVDPPQGHELPYSWRTRYASPPAQFRREFASTGEVVRARLYISSHGVYRAWINGVRVGQDELTPGWTAYESRLEYQAYDVTELIREKSNVIAAIVADGWWGGYVGYDTRHPARLYGDRPELIAQLLIEHRDGRRYLVLTDDTWHASAGEVAMADLLMGEYHDPARATSGWQSPGFDGADWPQVLIAEGDRTVLDGQSAEPMRVLQELAPIAISSVGASTVVDFGQNLVGHVRLAIGPEHGPAGQIIELLHGEILDGDHVYRDNLRTAEQRDVIISTGTDLEFEPFFTLHGFRYVEIKGAHATFAASALTAVVIGSDLPVAGGFSTGAELVEKLQSNIVWSQRGNYVGLPTDCPQRDERLGWTADTQVFIRTGAFNSDVQAFMGRWMRDLTGSQLANGCVPDVVPVPPGSTNFGVGAPGWGDAAVIVPWVLYEEYGDRVFLQEQYLSMRAWVEWVSANNPDGLWTRQLGNNYGDWLSVDEGTSHALVGAAYRIRSVDLVAKAADALGVDSDGLRYRELADTLRQRFTASFVTEDGRLFSDTQTAYLFALAWKLVPDSLRPEMANRLVEKLEKRGRRLTSGFLGVSLLAPVLTDIGRPDLAVSVLLQREYPSWGYSIDHGATTIWERWDGWTEGGGFQSKLMNSFNHYSLGSIGEWLYRRVGGIDQAFGSVGYQRARIAPLLAPELSPVNSWHETVRGRVSVSWALDPGTKKGTATVQIPPGMEAELVLPGIEKLIGPGIHKFNFETSQELALS